MNDDNSQTLSGSLASAQRFERVGDADLYMGDCLEVMRKMPKGSIDMILCDLPYGTTDCKWDAVIPFEPMWIEYRRLTKPNAAIVLTASQPFTSALLMSNAGAYKHCWIWDKSTISNPMQAKHQPLRQHEDVIVFCFGKVKYFPQKTDLHLRRKWKQYAQNDDAAVPASVGSTGEANGKYPKTIVKFKAAKLVESVKHPTQKPVALMEYMIRTYTTEKEVVLDNTMGSGTTGVAALKAGRRFVGIERDENYFEIACQRIQSSVQDFQNNQSKG